jgi:hypothetical protein
MCILVRYAQERKRAVSNRKWMFHCGLGVLTVGGTPAALAGSVVQLDGARSPAVAGAACLGFRLSDRHRAPIGARRQSNSVRPS